MATGELENGSLSVSEILEVFVNTWTAAEHYSLGRRKYLERPIQLQLSKKQKKLSEFFAVYLKSTSNFEHFEEKDEPDNLRVFEIRDCKSCG